MNRRKIFIITIATVVLWIVGLIFLTQLVLLASNRMAKKTDIDLYKNMDNSVIFAIDKITFIQNPLKDVEVSGWAFIEFAGRNPNKKVNFIFSSEENSYIVSMKTHDRIDLITAPTLANYSIPKYRNGFEGTFSPLMMNNGIYKLYIYMYKRMTS